MVTEHQSCQRSDVDGAKVLVGVNLFAISWLLSRCGLNFSMGSTLACRLMKPIMSGSRDDCNGTRSSAIKHFCMEGETLERLEAHKVCEGRAT